MELDINFPDDLRPSVVARICKTLMRQHATQSKPASKRDEDEFELDGGKDSDDDSDVPSAVTESDKLAELHSETHGSPAPLPVKETDYREGSLRKVMRKMPPAIKKKGKRP